MERAAVGDGRHQIIGNLQCRIPNVLYVGLRFFRYAFDYVIPFQERPYPPEQHGGKDQVLQDEDADQRQRRL